MTHRAETIMQAVTTNLTGLTTTGANVARGRAYAVAALPALSVSQGAQGRSGDFEDIAGVARTIEVEITVHVQQTSGAETTLNQIEAEIYAALKASTRLGLAYVMDLEWQSTSAPEHDGENTETRVAQMVITFAIEYEHSTTSTEA